MTFYKDIALLHSIMNKQSLFFAELVSRMDEQQRVHLSTFVRHEVMAAIKSTTSDDLATCRQMLNKLVKCELITSMGGSTYMINPRIHGHSNVSGSIKEKEEVYIKLRYNLKDKERTISVG